MQIAILTNPITVGDYHELFPNTSFSANGPSNEFLAENNAKKVTLFKAYDKLTQKLVSCEPYDDGEFVSLVKVESLPDEEIASARNASMAGIRATRNQLLKDTDGTQAPDNPSAKKTDWAIYRQALRDLPSTITEPRTFTDWPKDPDYVTITP